MIVRMALPMDPDPLGIFASPADTITFFSIVVFVIVFISVAIIRGNRARKQYELEQAEVLRAPVEEKLEEVLTLAREIDAMNRRLNSMNIEVQAAFALQMAATRAAKQDAQNAQAVAALTAEQREAAATMVRAQLEASLANSGKTDRRFQIWVAIASFVAGVAVTVLTTVVSAMIAGGV